jgi:hypothetical protein
MKSQKALLTPSMGFGLRPAMQTSKFTPDKFVSGEL